MNINQEREALRSRLQSKKHRVAFVSATVDQTIPFQIKALRLAKERNWTQEELAQRAGMKQERISTCENPSYGNFSLRTLKQLAAAFDVALIVRFAPFGELAEWEINMSSESLEVPSFDQEDYFKEKPQKEPVIEPIKAEFVQLGDVPAITAGNFMGTISKGMGGLPQQPGGISTLRLLQGGAR